MTVKQTERKMTDIEKLTYLIKNLKEFAEAKHCYDLYGVHYAPSLERCTNKAFDNGNGLKLTIKEISKDEVGE